jgi:hypothetical protein
MAASYEPIKAVRTLDGTGIPAQMRMPEDELQTFKVGTPVSLTAGLVQASAFGGSELVYGVSAEAAHNLAVDGTAEETSEATPPNQAYAVTTPVGAWVKDGKCAVYLANGKTVFSAMLKDGQVYTITMATKGRYELEYDSSSGFWFIDNTNNGSSDENCCVVIGVDPSSPNSATLGARVFFMFHESCRYFV